jgi:hypothetical protein
MKIGDYTEILFAQVLGESPGDQILGMPAKEFKNFYEQN